MATIDPVRDSQEKSSEKTQNSARKSNEFPADRNLDNYWYEGFWCPKFALNNVISLQKYFQAKNSDIIVATKPKCGTTWLKSLVYSVVHRTQCTKLDHPLLTKSSHELVPSMEFHMYSSRENQFAIDLTSMTSPRLFGTHLPYDSLPTSVKESECRIVYMCRNPLDTFVSYYTFMARVHPKFEQETKIEDFMEIYCKGEENFGPHWDHVLGYWKKSLEQSDKVLFIKYEDMKENGVLELKKLAKFLGCGFSLEEEKQGIIEEILELCSLSNMKELEVNKTGKFTGIFGNEMFFRKGLVGDWVSHLSPSMAERLQQVMKDKFQGSGLEFKMHP